MKTPEDRIKRLDSILIEKHAPVLKYLNPGLKRETLLDFFLRNGIQPTPSLLALYEWHNGVTLSKAEVKQTIIEIMPNGIFYSLEDALRTREDLIRWDFIKEPSEYLPIFGSGEDDLYLLRNSTGEVYYFAPAVQIFGEKNYRSIEAMLDIIIECYNDKIFGIDLQSGLQANFEEFMRKVDKYK